MERSYLTIRSSTSNSSVQILEGVDNVTHEGVPLVTVEMKTFCHNCQQEGYIQAVGERPKFIWSNNQQFALDGDINHCGCADLQVFKSDSHLKTGATNRTKRDTYDPRCEYLNGNAASIMIDSDNKPDRDNSITEKPRKNTKHIFPDGDKSRPAFQYDIDIFDHPISIFYDKTRMEKGLVRPSVQQVIDTLRIMPLQLYNTINSINISSYPISTPDPTIAVPGRTVISEFEEQAGHIGLFPVQVGDNMARDNKGLWPNDIARSTLIHEAGHTFMNALFIFRLEEHPDSEGFWSQLRKNNLTTEEMAQHLMFDYQTAIKLDTPQRVPSQYARMNMSEDFAESTLMYFVSKGTPCEDVFKKLYPHRYQFFYKLIYEEEIYDGDYDEETFDEPKHVHDEHR